MDPAPLMTNTLDHPAQGGHQPGVLVRDHQPDPAQAAFPQGPQERPPEHLVLGVADVQAEDLPATARLLQLGLPEAATGEGRLDGSG